MKYFACNVAHRGCGARHRNWLGGWDRCRACVSTGHSAFYRIAATDATSTSAPLLAPNATALPIRRRDGGASSRPPGSLHRPHHNTSHATRGNEKRTTRLCLQLRRRQIYAKTRRRLQRRRNAKRADVLRRCEKSLACGRDCGQQSTSIGRPMTPGLEVLFVHGMGRTPLS